MKTNTPSLASPWQTRLWQQSLLLLMTGATAGVQRLSPPTAQRFGSFLGNFAYRVAKKARQRTMSNLKLAYGTELSLAEGKQLAQRTFQHFGRGIVEFLRAPFLTTEDLARRVTSTGWEHIEAARAAGNGGLIVTAHLGNWEVLGRWLACAQQIPLTVVARDPENAAFAGYIRRMRENAGFAVLSKGQSARGMLRALQQKQFVLILADQNSGDLFAPFFGVPAGTVASPATLALHSGSPLLPVFSVTKPDGSLEVICYPPIASPDTKDRKADVQQMMAEYNTILEKVVREYPDQWLWLHNRWKSAFEKGNQERAWGSNAAAE